MMRELLIKKMREKGLKLTPQRFAIIDEVRYPKSRRVVFVTRLRCHRRKGPKRWLNKPEDKESFFKISTSL
jgi:hypothetical protein